MEFLRLLGLEGLGITPCSHHLATDGFVEKMGEFVSELYGWEFEPLDAEGVPRAGPGAAERIRQGRR